MQYFKDIPVDTKGHPKGLISDGKEFPIDSVQSCLNMDFFPTYDRRRKAYISEFEPTLPANHTIVKVWIKKFVDSTDTTKNVFIILVKDSTDINNLRYKIYVDYYYNPANTYDNYHNSGTTGYYRAGSTTLTEITEYYAATNFETGSWSVGISANMRALAPLSALLSHTANAYKGWYVYSGDNIVGIITDSVYSTDRVYFVVDYSLNYTWSGLSVGITRFPVGLWSRAGMVNITENDIHMVEHANAVTIHLGTGTRPIWLGMIRDRKALRTIAHSPSYTSGTDWSITCIGTYNREETSTVDWKITTSTVGQDTTVVFYYKYSGTVWIKAATVVNPINGGYDKKLSNGVWYFFLFVNGWQAEYTATVTHTITALKTWDGYWAGYDIPLVPNKKSFGYIYYSGGVSGATPLGTIKSELGNELGIWYEFTNMGYISTLTHSDRIYALCLELDGYQTIYTTSILTNGKIPLEYINMKVEKFFDRRITASLLFYNELDEVNLNTISQSELPETYLCNQIVNGYMPLRKLDVTLIGGSNHYSGALLYEITQISGETTPISTANTGLSIYKYLNNYYWKNVVAKAKFATNVGNHAVLCSLSADTMNADLESSFSKRESSGMFAINVSQVQNSNINARSVFASERIQEVVKSVPTGIVEVMNGEFIVFTKESLKWMKIVDTQYTDFLEMSIATEGDYQGYGTLTQKTIVRAATESLGEVGTASAGFGAKEFHGIFFLNYESIYGFFRNEPVDLLDGAWKDAYKLISTANKDAAIGGYHAASKEVWFLIGDYIYIFNLPLKHWKVYQFTDKPIGYYFNEDNQLIFHTSTKIFRTQKETETQYLDKGLVGIPFHYEKWITLGTQSILKIFDRLDVYFFLDAASETIVYPDLEDVTIEFSSEGLVGATSEPFDIPAE